MNTKPIFTDGEEVGGGVAPPPPPRTYILFKRAGADYKIFRLF